MELEKSVIFSFVFGSLCFGYLIILQYIIKSNYNTFVFTHTLFVSIISFILNFIGRDRKVSIIQIIPIIFSILYGVLDYIIIICLCNTLSSKSYAYILIFIGIILFCLLLITMKLTIMILPAFFLNYIFLQLIIKLEVFEATGTGFSLENIEFGLVKNDMSSYILAMIAGIFVRFMAVKKMRHHTSDRNYGVLSSFWMVVVSVICVLYKYGDFVDECKVVSKYPLSFIGCGILGALSHFLMAKYGKMMDFHYILGFQAVFCIVGQLAFFAMKNYEFFMKTVVEKELSMIYLPFLCISISTLLFLYPHKMYYYWDDEW
ncbi:hypothetical protein CWI39_0619p0010 [Hamiltosporidium magnivora]|uniref:Uncharacterized protein n=1 Tax=Hamiltosporidium magnivora TaxID=148818 RepID=A0A4Q9LFX5_9MICR|nr:hypothetical protein CWI39_0619p0010 [Hamiltosporidium magnivora]